MLFPRERSVFFCEAGNRSIDLQVQRIRIILCSVKLRVLNPKLQKQRYIREIKKNDTSQTKHANIIENVCFFSRASGRFATQEGTKAFIVVVSSFGFGRRLLRRGCPVDAGSFSSFLFVVRVYHHHHHLSSSACGIERNYILFSFRDSVRLSSSRVR